MRKANRIKDIPSCGQNVLCVRQYLRTLGQVKTAVRSVTHPVQSLSFTLESIFCISSVLVEWFSPGVHPGGMLWDPALTLPKGLNRFIAETGRSLEEVCTVLFSESHSLSPQNIVLHSYKWRYRSVWVDKQPFGVERGWREKLAVGDVSHKGFSINIWLHFMGFIAAVPCR